MATCGRLDSTWADVVASSTSVCPQLQPRMNKGSWTSTAETAPSGNDLQRIYPRLCILCWGLWAELPNS